MPYGTCLTLSVKRTFLFTALNVNAGTMYTVPALHLLLI